jgi:hypothetical protein
VLSGFFSLETILTIALSSNTAISMIACGYEFFKVESIMNKNIERAIWKTFEVVAKTVARHPIKTYSAFIGTVVLGLHNPLWVDTAGTKHAVEAAGLTPVEVGGYRLLSCDARDRFRTGFTAINAKGQRVTGTVCSGFFKGNTLRFD